MKTYKVTITYEVEIVDEFPVTTLHVMDAVYQSQLKDCCGVTDVRPQLSFHVEEESMSIQETEC